VSSGSYRVSKALPATRLAATVHDADCCSASAAKPWSICLLIAAVFTCLSIGLEKDSLTALLQTGSLAFSDPDDALRLAQVRGLMAGASWFDPVITSMGDGAGLQSHWSRLIDLPVAFLILGAKGFTDVQQAELVARVLWPKLVLFGFLAVLIRQLTQEAGRDAPFILLGLYWLAIHAVSQFQLGRIDHHNVQNACATLALVMVTAPSANGRSALAAGLLAGLGLAIGYEALPFIGLAAGLSALAALWNRQRQDIAEGFAAGLALSLTALFLLTVSPQKWLTIPCDALGLNIVAGAIIGCLGLLVAGMLTRNRPAYGTALAITGGGALLCAWMLEPVCTGGPFAKSDPAIGKLWLNHVAEAHSLLTLAETQWATALATAISLTACLLLQAVAAWKGRTVTQVLRLVLLTALTVVAFRYLKMISYAQLFGFYCAAVTLSGLVATGTRLSPRATMMTGVLLVSPVLPITIFSLLSPSAKAQEHGASQRQADRSKTCWNEQHLAPLAALPPARILPQQDLGASMALMQQHHSLAAPYHRLDKETLRAASIFQSPTAEALQRLRDWKVDIVALCLDLRFYEADNAAGTLSDALERDMPPPYLLPIDMGQGSRLRAYRVLKD
jgi:hypothetical protein